MKRGATIIAFTAIAALPLLGRQPAAAPVHSNYHAVGTEKPSELGAESCKGCHSGPLPDYEKRRVYDFISPNPAQIWESEDPHRHATARLDPTANPIAARIQSALGLKDVQRTAECLTCHAVDHTPAERDFGRKQFAWSSGVGCEACHGVADQWFAKHVKEDWRAIPPDVKVAQFRMDDLRDPAKRAAKCASCHVGNMAEGKFVTHEMYAAGHPPLLPFESSTFGRDQPAHWKLPEEMPYLNRIPADQARRQFHYRRGESSSARDLAVGAFVNLRESARLMAEGAALHEKEGGLDYAHFDCFACHHDLRTSSQRQLRGYDGGIPGRPPPRHLPADVVQALLPLLRDDALAGQFQAEMTKLRAAFDARPFGDARQIASATKELMAWSDRCLIVLDGTPIDDAARQALVKRVLSVRKPNGGWDYDTAQLMGWTVRALHDGKDTTIDPLAEWILPNARSAPQMQSTHLYGERLKRRYDFRSGPFAKSWAELK